MREKKGLRASETSASVCESPLCNQQNVGWKKPNGWKKEVIFTNTTAVRMSGKLMNENKNKERRKYCHRMFFPMLVLRNSKKIT